MGITASSPDAFFDGEDWRWDFVVNQPDGLGPLDLTGSRLFARFCDAAQTTVGVCDSAANDGSLVIADGTTGACTFSVLKSGRTWVPPRFGTIGLTLPANVYGDLYRYPPSGAGPEGVCRIRFTVLPGTGLPS